MSGFLDHLFDASSSGKKGRERIRYREKLRGLIQDAPAVRRLSPQAIPHILIASLVRRQLMPRVELVVEQVGDAASAESFRAWKQADQLRPIWRLDPVSTEEQVLESRAMGADAYTIAVQKHDLAHLQFLVEVGRDYGMPTILRCETPEDLALAVRVQDGGIVWLRGDVQTPTLFDWESLGGKTVLYESPDPLSLEPGWVCSIIHLIDTLANPVADKES